MDPDLVHQQNEEERLSILNGAHLRLRVAAADVIDPPKKKPPVVVTLLQDPLEPALSRSEQADAVQNKRRAETVFREKPRKNLLSAFIKAVLALIVGGFLGGFLALFVVGRLAVSKDEAQVLIACAAVYVSFALMFLKMRLPG